MLPTDRNDIFPNLVNVLKYANGRLPPNLTVMTDLTTRVIYSENLNQIIIFKFPSRKAYISQATVRKYLQFNRTYLKENFAPKILNKAYVLNIVVSEQITKPACKSCKSLGNYKQRNKDMAFNPKYTDGNIILNTKK